MQTPTPPWYNRDMAQRRVTYTHPSMSKLPMKGYVEASEWEGEELFYPDDEYVDRLFKWYGYDADAGLSLDDATVTPLP